MRVLVTGANGFLGAHVVARLAAAGHEIRASARQPLRAVSSGVEAAEADLASGALPPLVAGCEAVVHCAARAAPWGPRDAFLRDNVEATRRLVDAALAAGTVRRFVHISSPSIYFRYRDATDIGEQFAPPVHWPTAYAETKWASEQIALAARGIGPVALRPRAIFGPGDRAILPRLVAVARRGFFPLPGGGRAAVDVTCIDNVLDAIDLALRAPASVEGRAFNITNGEPMPVRELLSRLFLALGMPVRLVVLPRPIALGLAACAEGIALLRSSGTEPAITRYGMGLLAYSQTLSIAAARQLLGYQPRVSTEEGLRRFAAGSPHP
ncbi:MAG TPA: NAD-dependent epimerase/dehydratase family protein [Steroidobacteraceae bacterium]|nr:NAD-dependent epimerase/dehydratase family protein [Steroidobacteraceae bacterium]